MPSPSRDCGSTSAAAVAEAVVAAENPMPCKMRAAARAKGWDAKTGNAVPTSNTAMPETMTIQRPRRSTSGPATMRVTAAESEKAAASKPASVVAWPDSER